MVTGTNDAADTVMPSVPTSIRAFFGIVAMATMMAAACPDVAAQESARVRQPSQPFTSADAFAAYNRANLLARKGDHVAARRQFDAAIELEPRNRNAFVGRCIAYRHLRDYEQAMRDCEEAIRLGPNDAEAYLERGVTRLLKADRDAAAADFTEAIRLFPQYSQAFNNRAATRLWAGAAIDAILPDLDEAIRLDPDSFDAHFNRAAIFIKLREWDRALEDCGEAIRLRPDDAITFNNAAVAWRGKGDHDLAIAHYAKALSLDLPEDARQAIEKNVKEYAWSGSALAPSIEGAVFGLRPRPGAIFFGSPIEGPLVVWIPTERVTVPYINHRAYDAVFGGGRAQKSDPPADNAAAYFRRGQTFSSKGDYDRAIVDFSEALRLDPDYRPALNARANEYARKGAYDKAIEDFGGAIRVDSRDPRARIGRCAIYYRKGDWDHAIADCSEVLRITPDDLQQGSSSFHSSALSVRGDAYLSKGDEDHALRDYREVLRGRLIPTRVVINLGVIYLHKGDWDRALAAADRALRYGKLPRALVVRGQAFVGRGEYGSAVQDFSEAIKLDPKSAAAFMGRGEAYEKQGDGERAIADYRAVLALEPDIQTKSAAEAALARLEAAPRTAAPD